MFLNAQVKTSNKKGNIAKKFSKQEAILRDTVDTLFIAG